MVGLTANQTTHAKSYLSMSPLTRTRNSIFSQTKQTKIFRMLIVCNLSRPRIPCRTFMQISRRNRADRKEKSQRKLQRSFSPDKMQVTCMQTRNAGFEENIGETSHERRPTITRRNSPLFD